MCHRGSLLIVFYLYRSSDSFIGLTNDFHSANPKIHLSTFVFNKMFQHIAKFSLHTLLRALCAVPFGTTELATSYSSGTIRSFSPRKAVYTPKSFIPHAASRRQTFVHCERFPTAASRRSVTRISLSLWLVILSDQLPVIALVGLYPANKLIGRRLLSKRRKALIN